MLIMGRVLGGLVSACTGFCALAVILMMAQIVLEVIIRNFFHAALPGTTVMVTNYWMIAVAYLPLALTEKLGAHITVDMAVMGVTERVRRAITALACLFSAVIVGILAWRLLLEAMKNMRYGTFVIEQQIPIPVWPSYFFLPIGLGIYGLVLLYRVLVFVTGAQSGLNEAPLGETVHSVEESEARNV